MGTTKPCCRNSKKGLQRDAEEKYSLAVTQLKHYVRLAQPALSLPQTFAFAKQSVYYIFLSAVQKINKKNKSHNFICCVFLKLSVYKVATLRPWVCFYVGGEMNIKFLLSQYQNRCLFHSSGLLVLAGSALAFQPSAHRGMWSLSIRVHKYLLLLITTRESERYPGTLRWRNVCEGKTLSCQHQ